MKNKEKVTSRDWVIMDRATGEILGNIGDSPETFCYLRLTEGVDWVYHLSSSEIKVLLWLVSKMTRRSRVKFSRHTLRNISGATGIGTRTVRVALGGLQEKNLIKDWAGIGYIVSPETFSYFKSSAVPFMLHRFRTTDLSKEEY